MDTNNITTFEERAKIALKQRMYVDYERLMLLAVDEEKSRLNAINRELECKRKDIKRLLLDLHSIQSMLLDTKKADQYYDDYLKI